LLKQYPLVMTFQSESAWALAELGRTQEAQRIVAGLQPGGFAALARHYVWLTNLCLLARACSATDDLTAAQDLYDILLPDRSTIVVVQTAWLGPVSHDLGLLATTLGRYDDAEGHFAHATEVQERIGARATLVHTQLEWARMLLRRAQPDDVAPARALLEAALAGATKLSLTGIVPRIEALIQRIN
jgi:hypothetical protein